MIAVEHAMTATRVNKFPPVDSFSAINSNCKVDVGTQVRHSTNHSKLAFRVSNIS